MSNRSTCVVDNFPSRITNHVFYTLHEYDEYVGDDDFTSRKLPLLFHHMFDTLHDKYVDYNDITSRIIHFIPETSIEHMFDRGLKNVSAQEKRLMRNALFLGGGPPQSSDLPLSRVQTVST